MELTKEQRLDWYVYMYLQILCDGEESYNYMWWTDEVGELTGIPLRTFMGRKHLVELDKHLFTSPIFLKLAIAECEQSTK